MVKREIFFAGCNGFGTIYLMSGYTANGADEFVPGQDTLLVLPYTPNDFFGLDVEANGPYHKVACFKHSVGTHRLEAGTSLSMKIQGFVGETRAEACLKLTIALQESFSNVSSENSKLAQEG